MTSSAEWLDMTMTEWSVWSLTSLQPRHQHHDSGACLSLTVSRVQPLGHRRTSQ